MNVKFSGRMLNADRAEFISNAAPVIGEAFSADVLDGIIRSVSDCDGSLRAHREFGLILSPGRTVNVLASRDYDEKFDRLGGDLAFFSGKDVEFIVTHKFAGHRYDLNSDNRTLQGAVASVRRAQRGVFRDEDVPRTA